MKKLESVAWVLKKDGKVLCVKTKGKNKYFIPGGKLEAGETHQLGLLREIKEELNIDLIANTISHEFTVVDWAYGIEDTELEMHCYSADFSGDIVPDSEIELVKWIDKSEIDECAPAAQKAVLKVLQ
ncbi:NUDIX domain-containing protein [Vibrio parahaemolyticus]|uniref:NUDIX hydrolase n=1 Tax=Vibrio parahaemolyticus TaxID=670 RepID=UPI00226AD777|nr:NUDIX domain-containing protein [Vibrio parahaemolyticus]MCX8804577.1 NUDIX domain-containing protein [Vibrio parahaemolyticus]